MITMSILYDRLVRLAATSPTSYACIIDDRKYTYQDLVNAVDTLAKQYISNKGEVTLIVERKLWSQLVHWLALLKVGAYPVVCHKELNKERLEQMKHSITKIPKEADFAVLSSGTTGIPKVLWRSERSWVNYFSTQNTVFHINQSTKIFVQGSFSFTGNTNMILSVLWMGGMIISSDSFFVKQWHHLMKLHQVSHMYMLPTKIKLLMRHIHDPLDSVHWIITGSQMLDSNLMKEITIFYPNAQWILYYGASELNYISWCNYEDWIDEPGTVGKPFPQVTVTVREGLPYIDTPYGVEGITMPYTVGDKGTISNSGRIILQGRKETMINRGGYKLFIDSIEQMVHEVLGVEQAAAIRVDDSLRGDTYVLYIVIKKGFTKKEIEGGIKDVLTPIERPQAIYIVPYIPLTDCAKIDKVTLQSWYNEKKKHR